MQRRSSRFWSTEVVVGNQSLFIPGWGGGEGLGGMEDSFGDHMVFKGNRGRINHDQKSIKGGLEILQRGIR